MRTAPIPPAALALVLAVVVGCGGGGDDPARTPTATPVVPLPTLPTPPWRITMHPTIFINTQTPTRVAQPPQATISCLAVNGTPGGPCPTWTPTPTPADGILLEEVCELFGQLTPAVCRTPAPFPTPRSRN